MTPLGVWSLGAAPNGVLWLRFAPDPIILIGLGGSGVLLSFAIVHGPRDLRGLVVWSGLGLRALRDALGAVAVVRWR